VHLEPCTHHVLNQYMLGPAGAASPAGPGDAPSSGPSPVLDLATNQHLTFA